MEQCNRATGTRLSTVGTPATCADILVYDRLLIVFIESVKRNLSRSSESSSQTRSNSEFWLCKKSTYDPAINRPRQLIYNFPYRKAALADGAYGEGKAGKLGRLSLQDLVDLFDARRDRFGGDEEL